MITRDELCAALVYNPSTGVFSWLLSKVGARGFNKPAGTGTKNGYVAITLNQKRCYAHRLAWLWVYGNYPRGVLDHVNGNRKDNRISNLRVASISDNGVYRQKLNKNNTTGFHGVAWFKRTRMWTASIKVNWKQIHLGYFNTSVDAARAYDRAAVKHFGKFATTNKRLGLI